MPAVPGAVDQDRMEAGMSISERQMNELITRAQVQLANGGRVREVLGHLWRSAYSCGVRDGKAARVPAVPPRVLGYLSAAQQAAEDGWKWGAAHAHRLSEGMRISYGGTDPAKPSCVRLATVMRSGSTWKMEFADTGERVLAPVMFWAQHAATGKEDGSGKDAAGV